MRSGRRGPVPSAGLDDGRYVRLEPLDAARHGDDLFAAGPTSDALLRYLPERPFPDRAAFQPWLDKAAASEDPLFFAVVDKATGRAEGRLSLMRFDPAHGVIETGHLLFGPRLGQTRGATEAVYLLARHIFDELGYRRFEWKCNNANEPSKRAAARFGFAFEGVFRQHMVIKGENRDTAWYSMLDGEWPARRRAFERWLEPSNFDDAGRAAPQPQRPQCRDVRERRRRARASLGRAERPRGAGRAPARRLCAEPRRPRRRAAAAAPRLRPGARRSRGLARRDRARARRRADRSIPPPIIS